MLSPYSQGKRIFIDIRRIVSGATSTCYKVITGYKLTPEACNFPEIRPLGVTPYIVFMLTCYLPEDIPTKYDSKNRISASFPTTQVCNLPL
jgi:hypothetical protein